MEKIDNLDRQILEIISQNARILLKMSLQNVAFHAQLFISVCND
jgi:hypothetical protein